MTKTKLKKGYNLDDYQNQTWPLCYNDIPFRKLPMKSMHPFKSYWAETISLPCILPQQQKLSQKRAKIWPKFWGWLSILNLTCTMIYPSANIQWNQCIPVEAIERKPISTQQQKLFRKRAITQPKFWGWLPILNLTCILQWYTLLQTSEWNQCIPSKLIERKPISQPNNKN